ncbi:MAG: iron-containing alcohol dehydrogenase [Pseudomonadota bacterium]
MASRWLDAGAREGVASRSGVARETFCWPGALRALALVPRVRDAKRITLFTGERSYRSSGAAQVLASILPAGTDLARIEALPDGAPSAELRRTVSALRRRSSSIIVAIGGTRVLDQAKVLRVLAAQSAAPEAVIAGGVSPRRPGAPLVAVPTTPASGTEVTAFAGLSVEGTRAVLDHPLVRPEVALVDARLCASLPTPLLAQSGVQALSLAIDSLWSARADETSREHAAYALRRVVAGLTVLASGGHLDAGGRVALVEASLHAGHAVDHTRTGLLHAVAAPLGKALGVSLGRALALVLPQALRANGRYAALPLTALHSPRTVALSLSYITESLGATSAQDAAARLGRLLEALNLPTRCERAVLDDATIAEVVDAINLARLRDNPVRLARPQLVQLLERMRFA